MYAKWSSGGRGWKDARCSAASEVEVGGAESSRVECIAGFEMKEEKSEMSAVSGAEVEVDVEDAEGAVEDVEDAEGATEGWKYTEGSNPLSGKLENKEGADFNEEGRINSKTGAEREAAVMNLPSSTSTHFCRCANSVRASRVGDSEAHAETTAAGPESGARTQRGPSALSAECR